MPSQSQSLRTKLKFKEKLIVKGAGASTDVLLKKLKTLHEELSELDPDATDLTSLSSVRTELIHRSILFHKDPGVKAFAACCIADILKFYAPDAPYDSRGIRDIFTFILTLLSQQLTPSRSTSSGARAATHPTKNEFYKQYYYLIESMSTCKSVILMLDAEENDDEGGGEDSLVSRMFKEFFDLVRYDLPRTLTDHMTDILTTLIDEAATVSPEVRKILLDQFDKDRPSHHPRALELAVAVCEYDYPSQKIERSIAQYFLEILIQAPSHDRASSPTPSSNGSSSPPPNAKSKHTSTSAFAHSSKAPAISSATKDAILSAHSLIRSLAQYCPIPLLSTLPILESELETSDVFHRLLAVETLGEVFGSARGAEVVSKAKKSWVVWLGRGKDAEWKVRRGWVEKVGKMMGGKGSELKAELEPLLKIKLSDPEEHVREVTCKIFGHLDYETTLHHVTKATLKDLSARMMDRRSPVRGAAIHSVAKLYSLAFPEIEDNDPAAISLFGWIPHEILSCLNVSSAAVREVIEQTLLKWILPLPVKGDEEVIWVDKLLLVMRGLDEKSKQALLHVAGFNAIRTKWPGFLHACQQYNGGIIDENEDKITADLNRVIRTVSPQFSDPAKAVSDLKKFAEANEDRLYRVLKSAMDPQTDLKTLVKLNAEFIKRCPPELLTTMSTVLRRCSYPLINKTSIPTLLKRLQKTSSSVSSSSSSEAASDASNNARLILVTISKKCPAMFKSHVSELGKVILDEKSGTKVAEVPLQALAHLERLDSSSQTGEKKVLDRAMHFALEGTARQAKFAARLVAYSKKADELTPDLSETLATSLADDDDKLLHSHLTALSEIARSAPDAFEDQSELVTKFILDNFANPDENNKDDEDEWIEEEELTPRAKAKLVSLKLCTNRCAAHARTNEAAAIATPVINLLLTILTKRGSFASLTDGSNIKTRVRLQAGRCLLKLAIYPVYAKMIAPSFLVLAVLVQDPCFWVRLEFVKKLGQALHSNKLPASYNVMLFLTAHDEPDVRDIAKNTIQRCMQTAATISQELKVQNYDFIFVRLIHLLAHHPDYTNEPEDLKSIAKYLEFYLDLVMVKENVSLLYALAAKVKTVKDRDPEYNKNLYAVGELAQHIIQARTRSANWTIDNYPGKISMPSDLFRPLGSNEDVQKNMIKIYLHEETLKYFKKELGKTVKDVKPKVKKVPASNGEKRTPVKRKAAAGTSSARKRAAKKKRQNDSSEEEPSESEEEEEEEDDASPPPKKLPATNGKGKGKAVAPSSKNGTTSAKGKKKVVRDSDEEEEEEGDEEMEASGSEEEEEEEEEPVLGRGGRRKPAAAAPEVKKPRPKPKPRLAKPKEEDSEAMEED
ncbi:armadillo-type protein [Mrakia frigida]|uniref:sister chromatid cohesion factor PDS5 n=1 Tax=Mrakia frigida TaxID=29902 RepID=UPI003FCBF493